jgi:hypothetical protein
VPTGPPEPDRQDADGQPYFGYFDTATQAGFIWDGESKTIQVIAGGMSEPVVDTIDIEQIYPSLFEDTDEGGKPRDWLCWFKVVCDWYLDRIYAKEGR